MTRPQILVAPGISSVTHVGILYCILIYIPSPLPHTTQQILPGNIEGTISIRDLLLLLLLLVQLAFHASMAKTNLAMAWVAAPQINPLIPGCVSLCLMSGRMTE